MSTTDIKDFKYGEDVQLSLYLKDRPIPPKLVGDPLSDAATQVISFVISEVATGVLVVEFTSTSEIVLNSAPLALWDATFSKTALAILDAEKEYTYDLWSTSAGGTRLHQNSGVFYLGPMTAPTP